MTHYDVSGPDSGRAIVLVHGFSVPYYIWDSTAKALAASGHRVIRYDEYGRGWSDRPAIVYNAELYERQLRDLLDSLRVQRVDVAGVSMGGWVTATFVSRHPERVRIQQKDEPAFSRWALFERAVLSKVANPEECKRVIALRQSQVDDDANEADLVAAHLRKRLRDKVQDPDTCCLFFTTAEITAWLQEATGTKLPINKTTRTCDLRQYAELSYSKKNGVPGWVSRGRGARPKAIATMFSKLGHTPWD